MLALEAARKAICADDRSGTSESTASSVASAIVPRVDFLFMAPSYARPA